MEPDPGHHRWSSFCKWVQMGDRGAQGLRIWGGETATVGHGPWAKRRELIGRKYMGQRTGGLEEMEQIILGIPECQSRKSRPCGHTDEGVTPSVWQQERVSEEEGRRRAQGARRPGFWDVVLMRSGVWQHTHE